MCLKYLNDTFMSACILYFQGFSGTEGSLSSHLVNVQVINSEGEFREFDIDYNGEQFDIFRSHLGLCGVIIRMTFRVSVSMSDYEWWR